MAGVFIIRKQCRFNLCRSEKHSLFSAISTQGPKKTQKNKGKNSEENGAESESEPFIESQVNVSSTSSQTWISSHPALVNKKLLPPVSYWIAITTPNGAPANPITIHRALLECGVHAITNTVRFPFVHCNSFVREHGSFHPETFNKIFNCH